MDGNEDIAGMDGMDAGQRYKRLPLFARVGKISEEFGLSAMTVRRMADRGDIRSKRVAVRSRKGGVSAQEGQRLIERASVYRYLYGQKPAIVESEAERSRDEAIRRDREIHREFLRSQKRRAVGAGVHA